MTELKIVSFNLRCLYDTLDEKNAFIHRAGMILEKIADEKPHVICFQEASEKIRKFLRTYLSGYEFAGHGRYENYDGEGLFIAWRKDSMELFALEHFWLSPTPYIPGSRYKNQSEYPRICPHVMVKHKDMKVPLRFFNVHLDNESEEARVLGIKQILNRSYEANKSFNCPTFFMGDFNARPDSLPIKACLSWDKENLIDLTDGLGTTYHDFGGTGKTVVGRGWKIDYIFTDEKTASKAVYVKKWEDEKNGIYLSDHYPVCCVLKFDD